METTGVRRVALTIVLSVIAAGIAVLNFGGGAIAQECGGGSGEPSPSPSTTSPSPSSTGGLPTLPLPTLPEDEETPSPSTSTNTPGGGGQQQTIECDSKISIRFANRTDKFSGAVTSDENVCERGRRVILKRVKSGPDQTVGRTTTNSRGRWTIEEEGARGRYYAQAPKRNVDPPGPGARYECGAAKSKTIRAS